MKGCRPSLGRDYKQMRRTQASTVLHQPSSTVDDSPTTVHQSASRVRSSLIRRSPQKPSVTPHAKRSTVEYVPTSPHATQTPALTCLPENTPFRPRPSCRSRVQQPSTNGTRHRRTCVTGVSSACWRVPSSLWGASSPFLGVPASFFLNFFVFSVSATSGRSSASFPGAAGCAPSVGVAVSVEARRAAGEGAPSCRSSAVGFFFFFFFPVPSSPSRAPSAGAGTT